MDDVLLQVLFIPMILLAALVFLLTFGIYFTPTIAAMRIGHRRVGSIFLLNLLLGWTVIGWIRALAWAREAQKQNQALFHADQRTAARGIGDRFP